MYLLIQTIHTKLLDSANELSKQISKAHIERYLNLIFTQEIEIC